MSSKFKNKYRIESSRLSNWDYSSNAAYFITICTANREPFFGEVNNGIMNVSTLGDMVEQEWLKSVGLRPDMNLSLGEYVIMPNHFHGIIFIGENVFNTYANKKDMNDGIDNDTGIDAMQGVSGGKDAMQGILGGKDAMHGVSTNRNNTGNAFGPQSKNLASIVRGFKSAVTTYARKNNLSFNWQPRFHDHIIRNEMEYKRITNYIINNPAQWSEDKFYS